MCQVNDHCCCADAEQGARLKLMASACLFIFVVMVRCDHTPHTINYFEPVFGATRKLFSNIFRQPQPSLVIPLDGRQFHLLFPCSHPLCVLCLFLLKSVSATPVSDLVRCRSLEAMLRRARSVAEGGREAKRGEKKSWWWCLEAVTGVEKFSRTETRRGYLYLSRHPRLKENDAKDANTSTLKANILVVNHR
ncbi:hypothetical protein BKA61DRAFT_607413 [Leptodontidium sp. MPI-SDFR-AT-0119]|nr:hypothetical protein BKA61DRAFT_607413 [Leptodontidium sp. MPI-SDFR-AT-0119]